MSSLLVICPSRGRPARAKALLESFNATKRLASTKIIFVLHPSDPMYDDYDVEPTTWYEQGTTLTSKLNLAAEAFWDTFDYVQFAADDMLYRTIGWDAIITSTLKVNNWAIGFANDLARHDIANHVVMDTRAVKALGWFALPTSRHLYLDNAWMALGTEANSIEWFRDVVIEHLHPYFGKGDLDAGYLETNSQERYSEDQAAYEDWVLNLLKEDATKVREAMRAGRGRDADGGNGVEARPAVPQGAGTDVR